MAITDTCGKPSGKPVQIAVGDGVVDVQGLDGLLRELTLRGFELIGPRVEERAIVYRPIESTADLPEGWRDAQSPGTYRLERRDDEALFGYVVGPDSWKRFLFPPRERLFQVSREGKKNTLASVPMEAPKRALIGVRPCELAAIAIQDKVFLEGRYVDPHYRARRAQLFIIAANCGEPAATCFCGSFDCGPEATVGFDLALTEIVESGMHEFVVQVGSPAGREVLDAVEHRPVAARDRARQRAVIEQARKRMRRRMDTSDVKELLYRHHTSPRWDEIAGRCLSCANCTMVCPTCFCSTVEDTTDLIGAHAERWRLWDSCFNLDHSYIVGANIRASTQARYRQWITHKLASWQDQFGTSGCVGCGRCITWCPVGIDITEEVAALRRVEQAKGAAPQREEN